MPPKVEIEFVNNLAKSFAKGQPYPKRIALTLFINQVHQSLMNNNHILPKKTELN